MAYQPLALAPGTPPTVRQLIRGTVEPLLQDVHCALRLPLKKPKLPAGFNFTVAHVLLAVVAGASTAFHRRAMSDGKNFTGLLVDFYPWDLETGGTTSPQEKADILWTTFRNPFSHSLGIALKKQQGKARELAPYNFQVKIGRAKGNGMKEREVVALERSLIRPEMKPTLVVEPHKRVLWVEPFYWGTRIMLHRLSNDQDIMDAAESYYVDAIARHRGATGRRVNP